MSRRLARLMALAVAVVFSSAAKPSSSHAYLYVWAGDAEHKASDFLGVVDADPASPHYGALLAAVPVGATGTIPHHTELEMPANRHLLVNGFVAGRTWLFDLSKPLQPRVTAEFREVGGFSFPHTFVRLANGHVLGTFQYAGGEATPPLHDMEMMGKVKPQTHSTGGLVELDERGHAIHSGSAADEAATHLPLHPYSVLPLPQFNLAISTTTDMDVSDTEPVNHFVQFWRLPDLKLMRTLALSPGPRGDEHKLTGEPKLLPDGSVYVHTFSCGLYLLRDISGAQPSAKFVYAFEGMDCGVPVVAGHYWLQPVPAIHGLVALDIADPEHPKEVSRVRVADDEEPHWLAIDSTGRRLIMNSGGHTKNNRLYIINFDPQTGALQVDNKFRDRGSDQAGVNLNNRKWPNGFQGTAHPHGALFSR